MTLADLDYPFHVVSNTDALQDIDTSFSYQAYIQDNKARAMCNDIPCQDCPFTCKLGEDRQDVLLAFVKENFPEFQI